MLCNRSRTVLYTGMTNSLQSRLWYHEHTKKNTFVKRYRCDRLVYYECYDSPGDAISREKQIKHWRREKKNDLVRELNPLWNDLGQEIRDPQGGRSLGALRQPRDDRAV